MWLAAGYDFWRQVTMAWDVYILDPSRTCQNEQNNKPQTALLIPGDQINYIKWGGGGALNVYMFFI